MALRLDDIKSVKKPQRTPAPTPAFDEQVYEQTATKLRPWQNEEQFEGTRTYAAKEAVERARERTRLNDELARELRQGHVGQETELDLKRRELEREKFFDFTQETMEAEQKKIRVSSPFVKFFRDLLRQ
jgi:DNA-nicking Smr family endonuclease